MKEGELLLSVESEAKGELDWVGSEWKSGALLKATLFPTSGPLIVQLSGPN